jgi:DNA-binding SARP family transcriptional activator
MARLHITLLGGFEARLPGGRVVTLPGQTAPALLGYLAMPPPRSHARDSLCALLWPDVPGPQARHRLRQTLLVLRRALLPAGRGWLHLTRDGIGLEREDVDVDVAAFERALAEGTPSALARAARLYRGDLLAGLGEQAGPFEEWLVAERERLRELGLEALSRVLAHQLQAQTDGLAIHTAARLLALDPAQEAVHRTLMRLYAQHGRRGAALRQYQSCVTALRRDLGAGPEPETRQLYQALLREHPPGAGRPSEAGPAPPPASEVEALLGRVETPFVGREPQRAQLHRDLEAAWSGSGRSAIILGEAGIGKSRLVAEAVREALDHQDRVMVGRAHETQQILPFAVWIEALRMAGVPAELLAGPPFAPGVRRELARLLPELGPAPATASRDYGRLFEALGSLFAALSEARPLVLVAEDLQWADEMTLRFLGFLSRRLRRGRVLILATARREDVTAHPLLGAVLEELRHDAHTTLLPLGPLARRDAEALVDALMPSPGAADRPGLLDRLWGTSEGNPFVLVELIRAIREGAVAADAPTLPLPERVRSAIAHRLGRLGERERHVLAAAAVIGREFSFRLLERVAEVPEDALAECVEHLVARGILHAVGDELDFTHDRVRDAAYAMLLPPRRRRLHGQVAAAVEALHREGLEPHYAALAIHTLAAEDWGRAVEYLVGLAAGAARVFAYEGAVAALRDALAAADRLPGDERDAAALRVVPPLARSLAFLGRQEEAAEVLASQEARVARVRDPRQLGPYFLLAGNTYSFLGDRERTARSAHRAVEEASRCGDDATMGKALYVLAMEGFRSGHLREGAVHARQAVALLERSGERVWLGHAHWAEGGTHLLVGDFVRTEAAFRQALALGQATGARRLEAQALWSLGVVAAMAGDWDAGIARCQEALDRGPDPLNAALALGWQGYACLEKGDAVGALGRLEQAVGELARVGHRQGQSWMTTYLGEAHLLSGGLDAARHRAEEGLMLTRGAGYRVGAGVAERALGRIARARGGVDEAGKWLAEALRTLEACEAGYYAARTRLDLAELAAAQDEAEAVPAHLGEAHRTFAALGVPRWAERTLAIAARLGVTL